MKQLVDYLIIERLDKNKIHQYEGMKGIDDNIQKWYKKKFSSDEAGDDIRANYTFGDLLRDIRRGWNDYGWSFTSNIIKCIFDLYKQGFTFDVRKIEDVIS